ncbi:MAG TPA: hypothetical protein VHP32_03275 [Ignavibacteria bacterium]|nr:hypothetical protein [Ignavibacteria bacterium]
MERSKISSDLLEKLQKIGITDLNNLNKENLSLLLNAYIKHKSLSLKELISIFDFNYKVISQTFDLVKNILENQKNIDAKTLEIYNSSLEDLTEMYKNNPNDDERNTILEIYKGVLEKIEKLNTESRWYNKEIIQYVLIFASAIIGGVVYDKYLNKEQ